jgi:site-specific DNA-methyltransferase (adenine-specific)
MINTNSIYLGDCLELMNDISDKSIDMILIDPPYQKTNRNKWDIMIPLKPMWTQFNRIIKDNGVMAITSAEPFTSKLIMSNLKYFRYDLIWEKSHATGFLNANRMPLRKHENILIFYKKLPLYNPQIEDKPIKNIRSHSFSNKQTSNYGIFDNGNFRTIPKDKTYPTSILKFDKSNTSHKVIHPTQKPIKLFEYLIKTYTNENDLILDCCIGSGTTIAAAINLNRRYIGMEIEQEFYDKALNRIYNGKEN